MDGHPENAPAAKRGRPRKGASDPSDRLIEAAKTEFLRVGYASATMDAIISMAQMSKRTAYAFGNKATLLEAVVSAHIRDQFEPIEAKRPDGMSSTDFLVSVGAAFLAAASDPGAQLIDRLLMGEARQFPELAARFHAAAFDRAKALVRSTFDSLGVEDTDLACDAFYALLVLQPLRAPVSGAARQERQARSVVNFILRGSGAAPGGDVS